MKRAKGILLYSGGLDSLLAAKLLMEQNIDLIGLHVILPFSDPMIDPDTLKISKIAKEIGLRLRYHRCGREYLEMIKNPKHGYGKHLNPCIDCRLYFIKTAAKLMEEENADFLATGEVVAQRPMSQFKHTMNHILKSSGIEGRLLRPLSAKILVPTIPEIEGTVDREKLMGISGRSRKIQIDLAAQYGIIDYSSPAGGCLFTDKFTAIKVKDLLEHSEDYQALDLYLLTIGRNFRISPSAKVIVSRNEDESKKLEDYRDNSDYFIIPDFSGPNAYVRGELTGDEIIIIASIISKYGKPSNDVNNVTVYAKNKKPEKITAPPPISTEELDRIRI